jgi:hypothetical protein
MFQLTETTLFHWDSTFEFIHHRSNDPKKDFAGARKVQSWMAKLQSTGPTFPPTQGSSASARSLATTVANTDHTASSESQPLVTPARSSSDGVGHCVSDVEASDGAYRDSVGKLPRYNERIPSMVSDDAHLMWLDTHTSTFIQDIIEVNSPCGQSPVSNGFSSNKATENYREHNDSGLPVAQAVSLTCCLNLELIKATNTQEDDDVEMHPRAPSRNHDNDIDKGSNADSDKVQVVQVESESGVTFCMSTIVDAPLISFFIDTCFDCQQGSPSGEESDEQESSFRRTARIPSRGHPDDVALGGGARR